MPKTHFSNTGCDPSEVLEILDGDIFEDTDNKKSFKDKRPKKDQRRSKQKDWSREYNKYSE